MTMTYSEARQRVFFKAARDMRALAAEVLNDVSLHSELNSPNVQWAVSVAKATAEKANELERQGHEECIASTRSETEIFKSKRAYEVAIDGFEKRVAEAKVVRAILDGEIEGEYVGDHTEDISHKLT